MTVPTSASSRHVVASPFNSLRGPKSSSRFLILFSDSFVSAVESSAGTGKSWRCWAPRRSLSWGDSSHRVVSASTRAQFCFLEPEPRGSRLPSAMAADRRGLVSALRGGSWGESLLFVFPLETAASASGRPPWFSHVPRNQSLERQRSAGTPGPEVLDVLPLCDPHFRNVGDVRCDHRGASVRLSPFGRRREGLLTSWAWNPPQVASTHLPSILRLAGTRRAKTRRRDLARAGGGTHCAHLLRHRVGLRRRDRDVVVHEPRRGERPNVRFGPARPFSRPDTVSNPGVLFRDGVLVAAGNYRRRLDWIPAFSRQRHGDDRPSPPSDNRRLPPDSVGGVRAILDLPSAPLLH